LPLEFKAKKQKSAFKTAFVKKKKKDSKKPKMKQEFLDIYHVHRKEGA
jgi:hypothetical protein